MLAAGPTFNPQEPLIIEKNTTSSRGSQRNVMIHSTVTVDQWVDHPNDVVSRKFRDPRWAIPVPCQGKRLAIHERAN